jgi:nitrogen fixation-related uncharacterized protein
MAIAKAALAIVTSLWAIVGCQVEDLSESSVQDMADELTPTLAWGPILGHK